MAVERIEGEPAEEDVRNDEDALDLDLKFDFEEWFWTEYSLSGSFYG
ncbi:predicted protein [Sclerotinia sclerotiorum 1980 UF-70]|uniref:Uncharacterized protein n=1 Tax=Sclerotinia sclerotiorum (strain ATCC 18683 / 1980 / Ss-1) TaxID=665079 RepID=A7F5L0_SCLS1|nr:predicted protein [Sclerotinia sclerotiorum 1980 UF-70]EDN98031.1 predicted protein [Sclerotinia sclerotiorum 1980 UF-70]